MTVDLTVLIVTALAGVVSTLAGIIYAGQRREIHALRKENRELSRIILSEAAKKDETLGEFVRLMTKQGNET